MRKKIICTIFALCVSTFLFLEFLVIYCPTRYRPEKADAILILGHSLDEGNFPGEWLTGRLKGGLYLYESGYAPLLIVSGGQGPTDQVPVANAMKTWLVKKGIPENNILVEAQSRNTFENFMFSKELCDANGLASLIIVTSDFHTFRSCKTGEYFYDANLLSLYPVETPASFRKFVNYIKEPFSYVKYAVYDSFVYTFCV